MSTRSKGLARKGPFRPPARLPIPLPQHLWHLHPVSVRADLAAEVTGRSARTVARWIATGIDDRACLTLLQTVAYGLIPHADWQEWHVAEDGTLCHWMAPREPRPYRPADLHHVSLTFAINAELRAEVARLRAALAAASREKAAPPDAAANDAGSTPDQLRLTLLRAL